VTAEPQRTCVGCGRKAPQNELIRFTARGGILVVDEEPPRSGRGAYTCRRLSCFERATARRAFSRTLRRTVTVPLSLKAFVTED
jgi:uncharacterized protein